MAGHSHWAGIKHKKAANDAKRGKLFSKLAKAVIVAAKHGGGDPDANLALKYAIEKAKAGNMTRDAIERAVKKGTGELESQSYESLMYEVYGQGGVALMVEILTDNRNRTASELRQVFEKRSGTLAEPGAVAWQFEQKGVVMVAGEGVDEDELTMVVLEAEAEDLKLEGGMWQITCEPKCFEGLRAAVQAAEYTIEGAEITFLAKSTVPIEGKTAQKVFDLIEVLDDHEDVQRVHANYDISEEVLAEIQASAE